MGEFVTAEAARERFRALADAVDAAHAEMRGLSSAEVGNEFRTEFVERLETQERTNRGLMYRFFGEIADDGHYQTSVTDTGRLAWTDGTKPPETNHAHHPEELLRGNTDPPENDNE
jgi:hypothetical protein